jgi:hypothetical protein
MNNSITHKGKVISIKKKVYPQWGEDLLRRGKIAWEIKVEPEIPHKFGINNSDKIYYG